MAGEDDQAKGEDASSPRPTPQNNRAPYEERDERPHVDEDAILREGIEARRRLGRQVAREALADPAGLTPERLRRLGSEGLQRFVVELRRSGLGEAQQPRHDGPQPALGSRAAQPVSRRQPSTPVVASGPTGKAIPPSPPDRSRAGPPGQRGGRKGPEAPAPLTGQPPTRLD